jgi:protein associated with RNAse G/E
MSLAVKIRGIYTTALTAFFLEKGIAIALPSRETEERFATVNSAAFREHADLEISDLEGKQGVLIQGDPVGSGQVIRLIKDNFLDAVFRERMEMVPGAREVEFAYLAKSALDEERNRIVPTLFHHHRLKTIASEVVDLIERKDLNYHPEQRKAASEDLQKRLIWDRYSVGKKIAIEHVKLDGEILYLSEGELIEADFKKRKLVLKRRKFKGRSKYDGLNVEKREGDYAITEVKEGDWFYKHTYLRGNEELIGWYFNVNTPVEFYPDRIRYVDLDVDVVVRLGGEVEVIDEPILERKVQEGFLNERLRERAIQVAYELRSKLVVQGGCLPNRFLADC